MTDHRHKNEVPGTYLGTLNQEDLYFCPQTPLGGPFLLARFGCHPRDYYIWNCAYAGPPTEEPFRTAYALALEAGLTFD